ncbi:MAG TPA: hypothetical protein P5120_09330 [Spirochaetota bacterium]|nr:hypothetical protein [Spirochaetota bacterium]HRX47709.1 hypothetical protein [Spirochaetota bacterium]
MKFRRLQNYRKTGTAVLAIVFYLCSWISAAAQDRSASLLGYIVIPDITITAERLWGYAEAVEPGKYDKDYFTRKAGSLLGDPALDNIKKEMPIVFMLFQNTGQDDTGMNRLNRMEFAVVLPVKDKKRYVESLQKMNFFYETNDDRMIISNKKSALFFAQREMKFYRKLSREKYNCDFRGVAKIESFMSVYRASIEAGLKVLQGFNKLNNFSGKNSEDEAGLAMGKFFLYGMLELAFQSKDYQIDVLINREYIDFSGEFSAVPGSDLSRFFDGETQKENRSLALLPGRGQLTYAGYLDMKRLRELAENLLSLCIKRDPSLEKHLNRDFVNAYLDYTDLYLGEFAVTYGFSSSGRLEIDVAAATGSSDEEHLKANDRFMEVYNSVMKKYEGMTGFSGYSMQKNYRKSGDVDVHRFIMNIDLSKVSDAEKEMMQKMFGKEFAMEFAVSGGFIAASTSPENLDKIIANTGSVPAVTELLSRKAFGPGMDSYADMDLISFMERIIDLANEDKSVNDPSIDSFKKMIQNLDLQNRNILFSAKYSKGVSYRRSRVPARLVTDFIRNVKEQQKKESAGENTEDFESFDESED